MHTRLLWLLVLLVAVATSALFILGTHRGSESAEDILSSPTDTISPIRAEVPYGEVTMAVGVTAVFEDVAITALEIKEDSRCPIDVNCIQAGTVTLLLELVSILGTSTSEISLGESITTEADVVTFKGVYPGKVSTENITPSAYEVTFDVLKRNEVVGLPLPIQESPITQSPKECFIGGCSSQICSNQPDMASDCMYREEYACYQTAICEVQETGECGWTDTPTLRSCLAKGGEF